MPRNYNWMLENKLQYKPVNYNPGIFGFVKAHKHSSGCAVVMSKWLDEDEREVTSIYYVRRLAHNAKPVLVNNYYTDGDKEEFSNFTSSVYDMYMECSIPPAIPDVQRKKVYKWEYTIMEKYQIPMNWHQCNDFLGQVWKDVGKKKKPPMLIQHNRYKAPYSVPGEINLTPNNILWTKVIILHEIAHELNPAVHHGPKFVKTVMDLYHRYLYIDREFLEETAAMFGVQFNDTEWVVSSKIKS